MLTMYLDESLEQEDGYAVVAGFIGKKAAWVQCVRRWRRVLSKHKRTALHMKELRKNARHKQLLEDLGGVPNSCGLRLVYCSVKVSDYKDLIADSILELSNDGYMTALRTLVVRAVVGLPKGERLEVICEDLPAFDARRAYMFSSVAATPQFRDKHGYPALAKWSTAPKSTLFEPADYAAYAILQSLKEASSPWAQLCKPILSTPAAISLHLSKEEVRAGLQALRAMVTIDPLLRPERRDFHSELDGLVKNIDAHARGKA